MLEYVLLPAGNSLSFPVFLLQSPSSITSCHMPHQWIPYRCARMLLQTVSDTLVATHWYALKKKKCHVRVKAFYFSHPRSTLDCFWRKKREGKSPLLYTMNRISWNISCGSTCGQQTNKTVCISSDLRELHWFFFQSFCLLLLVESQMPNLAGGFRFWTFFFPTFHLVPLSTCFVQAARRQRRSKFKMQCKCAPHIIFS